ncbi:MAG: hydroxyethylthiazole kinase [Methanosphaera sp.]|nr:hydroxyethylthiazole kinase [Methanosphaera sp.]
MNDSIINKSIEIVEELRRVSPLTHCITNVVTIRDCANATLAIGGSPIMANEPDEANEITSLANSLLVNIGTITKMQAQTMKNSVEASKQNNTPYVLDPVGVGISNIRNETPIDLINIYKPAIIRGNLSEIKAIAMLYGILDECIKAKGVDVADSDVINEDTLGSQAQLVKNIASKLDTVIAASGPMDIISDGVSVYVIDNGDSMMSSITGSGCMLGCLMASYSAITSPLEAAITATLVMDIAGEKAKKTTTYNKRGTGSFVSYLIDELSLIDADAITSMAKISKL